MPTCASRSTRCSPSSRPQDKVPMTSPSPQDSGERVNCEGDISMHDRITRIEEGLAMAFFATTALLVFIGAIARTVGFPLIWAIDIAQMSFVWACVLGADVALKRNVHIEIDILVRIFPRALRRILAIVFLVMIAIFLATLVYLGTNLTLLNLERPLGDVG